MKFRLPFKTFSTLQIREKHLLDKAYVEYPDFPLVVTGHSLGQGLLNRWTSQLDLGCTTG